MGWAVKHHRFPTLLNSLNKTGLQDSNPNIAAEVCRMVEWSMLASGNNRVSLRLEINDTLMTPHREGRSGRWSVTAVAVKCALLQLFVKGLSQTGQLNLNQQTCSIYGDQLFYDWYRAQD